MTITYILLAVTIGASIFGMSDGRIKEQYMFNAYAISRHKEWWRFLTHGLLHADFFHLFFNMLALYSFGRAIEPAFKVIFGEGMGTLYYTLLYVGALVASSVFSYFKHKDDMYYNALGASGAVCAIIFATILLDPFVTVSLIVIPIPGWIFGPLFLVVSWYLARRNVGNIGHDAHFWGAIYGVLFLVALKPVLAELFFITMKNYFLYGIRP